MASTSRFSEVEEDKLLKLPTALYQQYKTANQLECLSFQREVSKKNVFFGNFLCYLCRLIYDGSVALSMLLVLFFFSNC